MRIEQSLLDLIMKRIKIEYSGIHNSDPKNPLWGARAYWRIYTPDGEYISKITTPVKSLKPTQKTLDRLLRKEIEKRLREIEERCTCDHYGYVQVEYRDPYSIKGVLKVIEGKYYNLMIQGR